MIYFMHVPESRAVKIGCSCDVSRRTGEIQTANPYSVTVLGCVPGGAEDEAALHSRFRDYRLRGEWFRDDPELLREIAGLLRETVAARPLGDELRRRSNCRHGLRGVLVGLLRAPTAVLAVRSSHWDRESKLRLSLDVPGQPHSDPLFLDVLADDCSLLGPWPIVCRCWCEGEDA